VIDNEAGMEHLSRRTTRDVDFLVLVADPTMPSLRAVERILELSRELPVRIGRRMLLLNRVPDGELAETVARRLERLEVARLPDVPQDDAVQQAGTEGRDMFSLPGDSPALQAVGRVVEVLCRESAAGA